MVVKEENKKINEDELRSLLETYRLRDGEIVNNEDFPQENDTILQDQRLVSHDEASPIRKSNFEKKNEYLLEVKDDIPSHIYDTGSHWVSISKHNQLLKLDKAGIANAKLGTISIYRMKGMDRRNRKKYTAADVKDVQEFRSMLLSKSEGGFERIHQSTEIVKTINEDLNVPEKQNTGGMMGGLINMIRGKR